MRDFSIDKSADRIKINETKENFKEVLSCYYNGNYRSAIVLLYSVVITDILFKLKNLEETYGDVKAINILNSIKASQENNPTSSQWEEDLINKVREQTNLIDLSEKNFIDSLKKLRHLCAHPVLSQNYNLFNPNKETVKAHIRNMLECVLLKPSFFSRVIFDDFIQDIASKKDILIDNESLSKYLKVKYIDNFNDITLCSVFKSLWRITFNVNNNEANNNRNMNKKSVITFLDFKHDILLSFMEKENAYFSNIKGDYFYFIIDVFNKFPKTYEVLKQDAKIFFENLVKNNYKKKFVCFYDVGILNHIKYLFSEQYSNEYENQYPLQNIGIENIKYLLEFIENQNESKDFILKLYKQSFTFESAKERYKELIEPIIVNFTEKEMEFYLDISNGNQNFYNNYGISFYNAKQIIKDKGYNIVLSSFSNIS